MRTILILRALCAAALAGMLLPAAAQEYPAKPVRLLVGFPAGGPTDILARVIGDKLSGQIGQPVVVENRPGAAGNIAADAVSKAAADGYTLLYASNSIAISPAITAKLSFDPAKDLVPVTETASGSLALLVHPSVPAKSIKEFIEYARQRPGQLNYASSGAGTITHFAAELFASQTGIKVQHVPYKGSSPSLVDLVAGRVHFLMGAINTALPFVKEGKLRPLAVTGLRHSPALPGVPTLAESGLPGFSAVNWQGVFAPAGTPSAILARLNAEFAKAVRSPELAPKLAQQDMEPNGSSAADFGDAFRKELARWAKVAKDAGIKAE